MNILTAGMAAHSNAATQSVCPDRSEAIRLGRIAVDIMNLMPEEMNSSMWTKVHAGGRTPLHPARKFIDLASLIRWKPDINFHDLPNDFINHPTGTDTWAPTRPYGAAICVKSTKDTAQTLSQGMYYVLGTKTTLRGSGLLSSMNVNNVDISATGPKHYVPDGYSFGNTYLKPNGSAKAGSLDTSDARVRAAIRALQHVHYRMVGMVGNERQLAAEIDRLLEECATQDMQRPRFKAGGSYSGMPLFKKTHTQRRSSRRQFLSQRF